MSVTRADRECNWKGVCLVLFQRNAEHDWMRLDGHDPVSHLSLIYNVVRIARSETVSVSLSTCIGLQPEALVILV